MIYLFIYFFVYVIKYFIEENGITTNKIRNGKDLYVEFDGTSLEGSNNIIVDHRLDNFDKIFENNKKYILKKRNRFFHKFKWISFTYCSKK
jgi:hypothetical protein